MDVAVWIGPVVLGIWLVLSLAPARRWPRSFFLPTEDSRLDSERLAKSEEHGSEYRAEDRAGDVRRVVAIVPARNEAGTLPLTLPPLLAQNELDRVIVVDDRSEDGTADVARSIAQSEPTKQRDALNEPRLEVIEAGDRPEHWSGKVHAMAAGVEACRRSADNAGGDRWLLFSDADIAHRARTVRSLLEQAHRGSFDMVSVMARLNATSFWERLLVPPFVYFFHLLYPFHSVARSDSKVAAAAGGCVLVRLEALDRAGGLERIAGELIDDVALARLIKRSGSKIWLGFDPDVVSVRRYGLAELWNMVARNAFVQLRQSWLLLALVLVGILVVFCAPPVLMVWGAVTVERGAVAPGAILGLCGAVAFVLETWSLLPFVRHHRVPSWYAWTLPFASLLYALMTLSSALSHLAGRSSRWRGRVYGRETVRKARSR